jgi:glucosylceramidase
MKKYIHKISIGLLLTAVLFIQCNNSKKNNIPTGNGNKKSQKHINADVAFWVTKSDQSVLLQKQTDLLAFGTASGTPETITLDSTHIYQTVDGFGFTLTGGSASLINALPVADKASLLNELFGSNYNSIGISYLRVSLGASDLSASVFSYDDLPDGLTDINLTSFSLSKDTIDLIPLLKQILSINPNIKIMASPWSAPVWMKDNNSSKGGSLQAQYYNAYAKYFVKYIKQMQAKGIMIDAVTVQNEPQHGGNNPSLVMSALQQANFIKNELGPAFKSAGINTKIIIWDHNCDNATYPLTVLNDAAAKQYIDGTAFHLYAGDISALSTVHNVHPDKNLYFTEQWTSSTASFDNDFKWHIKNVVIGSMLNWSKTALEWNLANDGGFNPHTPGGCTQCKGAITLDGTITRNVGYYIIAQASKFIPTGSVRIASNTTGILTNVSFKTAAGKTVVLVFNESSIAQPLIIKSNNRSITSVLPASSAATYIW